MGWAGMESGKAKQCVFDRLMSLSGDDMLSEIAMAVLRNAERCDAHLACTRRLGCSWLALVVASRLSEATVDDAARHQVMALSA